MPAQVIPAVTGGPSIGQQYFFAERTTALIGREDECRIRFPKNKDHQTVSRHHCLLGINPPEGSIRDLGSRSGTYVNGQLIDKRNCARSAQEGAKLRWDSDIGMPRLKQRTGRIGFQKHTGEVRFRIIDIEELPPQALE